MPLVHFGHVSLSNGVSRGRRGPQWAENQAMAAHGLQAQWTKTYPQIVKAKPHSQKLQRGCSMTVSFGEDVYQFCWE